MGLVAKETGVSMAAGGGVSEGVVLWVLGVLYSLLVLVVGFLSRKVAKLRDQQESINLLTQTQANQAKLLEKLEASKHECETERRREEGDLYKRIEGLQQRIEDRLVKLSEEIHGVALTVASSVAVCKEGCGHQGAANGRKG